MEEVRFDERGRRAVRRWTTRRIVTIVLLIVLLLLVVWVVGYTLFNIGESVPGTGEGDVISP
jgi:hypothetical protein